MILKDLRKLRGIKALLVGDVILDHYIHGYVERISPEAPVPILCKTHYSHSLGGASNVAHNIVSLGAQVHLIGARGDDIDGRKIEELCREAGIGSSLLRLYDQTEVKTRMMASGQQVFRVDTVPTNSLDPIVICDEISKAANTGEYQVVIASDYAKGVITPEVAEHLKGLSLPLIVDAKPINLRYFSGAALIAPNFREAAEVLGLDYHKEDPLSCSISLATELGSNVLVTCGKKGMYLSEDGGHHISPFSVNSRDPTGAGDVVTSVMALSIGAGLPILKAAKIANRAAAISVSKIGTYAVGYDELEESLEHNPITP